MRYLSLLANTLYNNHIGSDPYGTGEEASEIMHYKKLLGFKFGNIQVQGYAMP
jgi:hypothetical protein